MIDLEAIKKRALEPGWPVPELREDVLALADLARRLAKALGYAENTIHVERHISEKHGCDQGPALAEIRNRAKPVLAEAREAGYWRSDGP